MGELLRFPGLLYVYEVDGRKYLQITNFTRHQHPHHREVESCIPGWALGSALGSAQGPARLIPECIIGMHNRNPEVCPEPASPDSGQKDRPIILQIPGKRRFNTYDLTEAKLDEYAKTYPDLPKEFILREVKKAAQWLKDNPGRRKTSSGMPRFLGNWLNRAEYKPAKEGKNKPNDGRPHNQYGQGVWEKMERYDRDRDIESWKNGTYPNQKEIEEMEK